MMQELEWKCIDSDEEYDTDNSLINASYIMEAPYRGGFLVKNIYMDYFERDYPLTQESITFVPGDRAISLEDILKS
jgi:hypothetical protein